MYITSYHYGLDPQDHFETFYFKYDLKEKEYSLILDNCYNSSEKGKDLKNKIEELGIESPYNEFKKKVNQLISKGV